MGFFGIHHHGIELVFTQKNLFRYILKIKKPFTHQQLIFFLNVFKYPSIWYILKLPT